MEQNLPTWNLADLYSDKSAPEIERDLTEAEMAGKMFAASYEGKLAGLSGEALAQAIAQYERMQEILGRLGSYAQLLYAGNMADSGITQFYQNISEKLNDISRSTLFFGLEINTLDEDQLQRKLSDPALARYQPWLRDVRVFKPYQLSDELEKLLHDKYISGRAAWNRLFDETIASLRFRIDGKKLSEPEAMDLLSNKDEITRKKAAKSIGKVFGSQAKLFALITNTLAKDKDIEDRWRKLPKPISSRNIGNYVEDEVVEALISTVKKNYSRLAHRYFMLKAKWLGKEKLQYWDRNAPLPENNDRRYGWEEAKDLVISSYRSFSPQMAEIGQQFFDRNWIDVPVRPGKAPGAFAHPTVPSVHPYLLLNYMGKSRDVMTLAHELGHGVHQVLAAKQGALMSDTPLTLAETASVFGEQLTFQEMLRRESDGKKRKALIAAKVEDMLSTVVRQVAFCDFETRVHAERKQGELTAERIGEIWLAVQKESLGKAFRFSKEYRNYWMYIPHFIHSPFYVYAYAFGDCLVNSLYAVYQSGSVADFEQKYLAMLEAGGTKWHKELLAPFGLDASNPDFWQQGIDVLSGLIDQLEA